MKKVLTEQENQDKSPPDTPDDPVSLSSAKAKARPAKGSIDDQVDALILRFETSSIVQDTINESLKNLNLRFLLEQEEEPADEPAADPPAEDDEAESTDEPAGSEDMTVSEPAEDVEVPNLDVDKFTMKVVRLVKNFQNLLNIEEAIINRTKNFLDDNYGEAFVREFTDNLSQKYGLEVKEFDNIDDVSDENFAVGAFAGGTGSLPTGGGG